MSDSGAKAALRGYRLQALYTLSEILSPENNNYEFQPEGKEDLAIYQGKTLVKAIQVKAYSTPLFPVVLPQVLFASGSSLIQVLKRNALLKTSLRFEAS